MKKNLILLLVSISIPITLYPWGFYGHRKINEIAIFSLPPELVLNFKPHLQLLVNRSTFPDQRRYIDPEEATRHYLDADHYGDYPFENLPHQFDSAVAKYTLDSILAHGIVPWHIEKLFHLLVFQFKKNDLSSALKTSAELGHYIADACVPLHASSNHNGQKTDQEGIHALWESRIPELLEESEFNLFVGHCEYINNMNDYIWTMFLESAKLSDTVLIYEKTLSNTFASDLKYGTYQRGKNFIRDYSIEYIKSYNFLLNDMVEQRMRRAIKAISSIWYTAWIRAGQPNFNTLTEIRDEELDSLNRIWINTGAGYVRGHE